MNSKLPRGLHNRIRWVVLMLVAAQMVVAYQQVSQPSKAFGQTPVVTVISEAEDSVQSGSVVTGYDAGSATTYIEFAPDTSVPPPSTANFQPSAPYYTTFYYPWYGAPDTDGTWSYWQDKGNNPPATWFSHYLPDLDPTVFDPATELYSSNDTQVLYWQLAKMAEAKQEVAVSSWWGRGHKTDMAFASIVTDVMNRTDNPYPNLRWTLYYEPEGYSDPSSAEIAADLNYIAANYANQPAYLQIDGKPVIFVWAGAQDGVAMAARWSEANQLAEQPFYIVLKLFSGYKDVSPQPDSWHQYGPASRYSAHPPYSAVVSPGFWLDDGSESPRLQRSLSEFRSAVTDMVAADAMWKIVTTWNEWGEGTSVEPGEQVRFNADTGKDEPDPDAPPFNNAYIDVLHELLPDLEQGFQTVSLAATMVNEPIVQSASTGFTFGAGGDHGANSSSTASLDLLASSGTDFYLAIGDMSYNNITPESAWCAYVKQHVGDSYPFEILVGNHEDRVGDNGFIDNFADCLPDRLGVSGSYAHRYYFDYPASAPLARIIMIDPDMYRGDSNIQYCKKGDTVECDWLKARIDEAKSAGLWVIVGMHKNCITMGVKSCEIGTELMDLLAEKKVDLVLQGHEHNYQRSKQLAIGPGCSTVAVNAYDPDCVADDGADGLYTRGQGTVIVIAGAVGASPYDVNVDDPEADYFSTYMGKNSDGSSGFVKVDVSQTALNARFMNAKGSYTDSFTITQASTPPTTTPAPTATSTPTPAPTATATPSPTPTTAECPILPEPSGSAMVTIDVPVAGSYAIWSRTSVSGANGSGFRLQVDDSCTVSFGGGGIPQGEWAWMNYQNGDQADRVNAELSAGMHTIMLSAQDTGVRIDKLLFTTDLACTPSGANGDGCLAAGNAPPSAPTNLTALDVRSNVVTLQWSAANDDMGVTGYDIVRDGNLLTSIPAATTFHDTSILPATAYVYTVRARDGDSNISGNSDSVAVTTAPSPTTTLALTASADAYVNSKQPNRNYGRSGSLRVDASPDVRSYLRFNIQGISAPVTRATLRLYATSSSSTGYSVYSFADSNWSEASIAYRTAPEVGEMVSNSAPVSRRSWTEVDVTSLVTGDGQLDLALVGISQTALALSSRESSSPPQLVIETAAVPPNLDNLAPGMLFLLPVADAAVNSEFPDGSYGADSTLQTDAAPEIRSYLSFDVGNLPVTASRAFLRIYASSASSTGYLINSVPDQAWDEQKVSYKNAPSVGDVVGSSGPFLANSWTEADVTPLITGSKFVHLAMTGLTSTAITFSSREGTNPPQMVLQIGDVGLSAAAAVSSTPRTPVIASEILNGSDSDQDGLSDAEETIIGTSPTMSDTDSDGLDDLWEVENGLNPLDPEGVNGLMGDLDGDGLTNSEELELDTAPELQDTDGDGLPDGWETNYGLDPRNESGANGAAADGDYDNVSNKDEFTNNTSPQSPDSDSDSLADLWEIEYGIDPASDSGESGADGDPDVDAVSNAVEQRNGTDPKDAQDGGTLLDLPTGVYLPQISR